MLDRFIKRHSLLVLILLILLFGVTQKVYSTSGGNFLFNMDNARDMVDVREMVELKKIRLIGPTSAVEGFYNGPGWYILLAIPYIIFDGDPYGSILLMITLWAIGGFFLMKLVSRYGTAITFAVGILWIGSNYINLATLYSFNPNPVTLLTPLFIYLLEQYLILKKARYLLAASFLGGLFFNFEMNFGIFIPPIILFSLIFTGNLRVLKTLWFWIGVMPYALTLLPQLIFDIRHDFIMTKSIMKFLSEEADKPRATLWRRATDHFRGFSSVTSGIFFDNKYLPRLVMLGVVVAAGVFIYRKIKPVNELVIICLCTVLIPMLSYIFILPVQVNPWHLGAEMVALIILFAYTLRLLMDFRLIGKVAGLLTIAFTIFLSANNIYSYIENTRVFSGDASLYKNEEYAIDYVYQKTQGKNFKAYVYMPSVIDYPYQYIFWYRGLTKYGYTPEDYAYAPGKPQYISNKEFFVHPKKEASSSGLVFLIKESDRINIRHLWENIFANLEVVDSVKLPGVEVVTLKEGEFIIY